MTAWQTLTPLDRARQIACSCLAALRAVDPDTAETYASAAAELGEAWLRPTDVDSIDGLVPADELAARMGVSAGTVRQWSSRGLGPGASEGKGVRLTRYPGGLFDPLEAAQLVGWAREGKNPPPRPSR